MEQSYNWWKDHKNKEQVEKLSWWNHEQNKDFTNFPISIIKDDNGMFTVSTNEDTEKLIGITLHGVCSAKTKEDAIKQMFIIIKLTHDYSEDRRLSYQRWVPFRKGPWGHTGGNWFNIFGINVYFRYGRGMKGGWYIPFTKLNISISSDWKIYRNYKINQIKTQ